MLIFKILFKFKKTLILFVLLLGLFGLSLSLPFFQKTTFAQDPVFSGLVGYWKLDEGAGTIVDDSAGQNDGIFVGVPNWENGKINKGLKFNGVDEAVSVNNNPSINLTQNFTISTWIRPDVVTGKRGIVSKVTDSSFKQFAFGIDNGRLHFISENNKKGFNLYSPANTIKTGSWQHVAVTVSPSFQVTLYINGQFVGSGTIPAAERGVASTQPLTMGRWSGNYNSNYFDGKMDEAGFWNRSLSGSEVSQLFNAGNGLAYSNENVGNWDSLTTWPLVAVHMALLQTGEVLMWDGREVPGTPALLWNPTTKQFTSVPMTYSAIYCAGMAQLPDGRMIAVGGHNDPNTKDGIKNISYFDPVTRAWSKGPDMAFPRWYPNVTTLGNNKAFIMTGLITGGTFADTPEMFDIGSNTVTTMPNANTSFANSDYSDVYLLPSGKVVVWGPNTGETKILDPETKTFIQSLPNSPVFRGSTVMYEPGKMLVAGGGNFSGAAANSYAATIDLNQPSPVWTIVSSMNRPRYKHQMVLLPDGRVMAVGGMDVVTSRGLTGPKNAEIWDPKTNVWTLLPEMTDPRYYHSTALLMPDGRVLSAGGGRLGSAINYTSSQIYNPDYLSRGNRPTISGGSSNVNYNANLTVQTPNAGSISRVTLVRPGSVTHGKDMDTRFIELTFTKTADSLVVKAPANSNIAPGGFYMLFIINNEGVPSTAKMVKIS